MRQAELGLLWVPRDQNEEADDLTDGDFSRFDEANRIRVDPSKLKWLVMDSLMATAEALYKEVKETRERKGSGAAHLREGEGRCGRRRPEERLRARDPW